MQAPPHESVHDIAVSPGEASAVEVGPQRVDGLPELAAVVSQVLRITLLEYRHADVEGEPVVLEQGAARRVAEQVLGEQNAYVGNADAHAGQSEVRVQLATEHEAVEAGMRFPGLGEDAWEVLYRPIMPRHAAPIDDEGIEAALDTLGEDAVEIRVGDDVYVGVDEPGSVRSVVEPFQQIAQQREPALNGKTAQIGDRTLQITGGPETRRYRPAVFWKLRREQFDAGDVRCRRGGRPHGCEGEGLHRREIVLHRAAHGVHEMGDVHSGGHVAGHPRPTGLVA